MENQDQVQGHHEDDGPLNLLTHGDLEVAGRITTASNTTLLGTVRGARKELWCVYKPVAGERPLWDFPTGSLADREIAAYIVSRAAGFDVVPPTARHEDGPFGPGSVQAWVGPVPHEDDEGRLLLEAPDVAAGLVDVVPPEAVRPGWVPVLSAEDGEGQPIVLAHAPDAELASMAVFDVLVNNADRKAGHLLRHPDSGRLLGVDHGLTFHVEPKLRTVLWGWAGERLPADVLPRLNSLADQLRHGRLRKDLAALLTDVEIDALLHRCHNLLRSGLFPEPVPDRPVIPWPPF